MFSQMKLGCHATPLERVAKVPRLVDHFALSASLPLIGDSTDYSLFVEDWGMYANDEFGCCVFAANAHREKCMAINANKPAPIITTDQVLQWYAAVTGFDKNDPSTDNGAVPLDALLWFQRQGMIVAFARVDPSNDPHTAAALCLFGGLYTAWDLPIAWRSTDTWDVSPDGSLDGSWRPRSWGGHMMYLPSYDRALDCTAVTWTQELTITNAARHVYCCEQYAIIDEAWLAANGQTIQGLDLDGLRAQLELVS